MEKFFNNIPYYIIEAVLVQKFKEYPDAIQINDRYIRMLENRIDAGMPDEIAIALNLLAPIYLQAYKIKRGAPLADEELQGYLDTLALFITTWVVEATDVDDANSEAFGMYQIPEYSIFPSNLQKAAESCIHANLEWARQAINTGAISDGTRLVRHIAAGLFEKTNSKLYQKGIRTAEATYLMHSDLVKTFDSK